MQAERSGPDPGRPGDRAVVVGAAVFCAGLLATLVTIVPLFLGTDPMPTAVYLLTALMPLGLAVALVGMVRGNRARRRLALAAGPSHAGRRGGAGAVVARPDSARPDSARTNRTGGFHRR